MSPPNHDIGTQNQTTSAVATNFWGRTLTSGGSPPNEGPAQADEDTDASLSIYSGMPGGKRTDPLSDCPACRATGYVESRLPGRKKRCDECGGKARITLAKREQIIETLEGAAAGLAALFCIDRCRQHGFDFVGVQDQKTCEGTER